MCMLVCVCDTSKLSHGNISLKNLVWCGWQARPWETVLMEIDIRIPKTKTEIKSHFSLKFKQPRKYILPNKAFL